jgi:hypothetical protein
VFDFLLKAHEALPALYNDCDHPTCLAVWLGEGMGTSTTEYWSSTRQAIPQLERSMNHQGAYPAKAFEN